MPNYRKNRRSSNNSTSRRSENSENDNGKWFNLLYYVVVGVLLYVAFMFIRNIFSTGGKKATFWEWLKSLFTQAKGAIEGIGSQGNGTGNGTGGGNIPSENTGGSAPSINDGKYFKVKEIFGGCPVPNDSEIINNYYRLVADLDKIREAYGSGIVIETNYCNGTNNSHKLCKQVSLYPVSGTRENLKSVMTSLKNRGDITGNVTSAFNEAGTAIETLSYVIK